MPCDWMSNDMGRGVGVQQNSHDIMAVHHHDVIWLLRASLVSLKTFAPRHKYTFKVNKKAAVTFGIFIEQIQKSYTPGGLSPALGSEQVTELSVWFASTLVRPSGPDPCQRQFHIGEDTLPLRICLSHEWCIRIAAWIHKWPSLPKCTESIENWQNLYTQYKFEIAT